MPGIQDYCQAMPFSTPSTIRLSLDRDAANSAERLTLWRDVMGLAGRVHVQDGDSFTGEFVSRSLGDLRTMSISSSTFRYERDGDMARQMRRDHVIVNLVERGCFDGRLAGRKIRAGAGALLISRLASPMDLLMENATWLALLLPRTLLDKHLKWSSALDARVFEPDTAQAIILGGLLRSLVSLPDLLPVREATCATRSSFALLAACLGDPLPSAATSATSDDNPARPIRRFIAEHLADPKLDVGRICREFSISRSHLYRIMGDSADIATIMRRMRLRAAQRDIASNRFSHLSLAEIGKRCGLGDERNFRRAFGREFGYPPSALRKQVSDAARSGVTHDRTISADLERWFLGL